MKENSCIMTSNSLNRFNESWSNLSEMVVFGYGRQAKKILPKLQKDFKIVAIVENDKAKCGYTKEGSPILFFDDAIQALKKYKIVVGQCNVRSGKNGR